MDQPWMAAAYSAWEATGDRRSALVASDSDDAQIKKRQWTKRWCNGDHRSAHHVGVIADRFCLFLTNNESADQQVLGFAYQ